MGSFKPILAAIASCGLFLSSLAQTPESILENIANRKPEKIFTHFDKDFYQPGETIWFKTYIIVDGRSGNLSTVLQAELINEENKVITEQLLPITVGTATGNFELPKNLKFGTYLFRLYTQHMLNTGDRQFFTRVIQVLPSATYFNPSIPVSSPTMKFFTEGGTFLGGELNIVAFAATDGKGKPIDVKGVVKDSKGNDIVPFFTEANGMGKIEITPVKNETYTAHFSVDNGTIQTISLPPVATEGTSLIVIDEVFKKRVIVNSNSSGTAAPAYLFAEMDQTMIFKTDLTKYKGHYMGRIPVDKLPAGLLHIAVFDANDAVIAERTCFINIAKDSVSGVLKNVNTSIARRTRNSFELSLPDSLEGTFSIAVTDASQAATTTARDNIIFSSLISSQLASAAGNSYFDPGKFVAGERNEAIDLLLLTQPYKWDWATLKKLSNAAPSTNTNPFITIEGKATLQKNNKPLSGELIFMLQTKDSTVASFSANTAADGSFVLPNLFFEDTALLFARNNTQKDADKRVKIDISSSPLSATYNLPVTPSFFEQEVPAWLRIKSEANKIAPARNTSAIDFDTSGIVLQVLVIKTKVKKPTELVEQRYSRGMFAGSSRQTIDFINNKPTYLGGNIFDYLKGRYSYATVMGNFPNYSIVSRNMRSLGSGNFIQMGLYLDEMPIDAATLTSIPMSDIALVRIYTSGFMGVGGALAVYTKRGEDAVSDYTFMNKLKLPGFSPVKEFFSPDYATDNTKVKSDLRKTLYWDPSLSFIPEDGKIPITFYTTDQPAPFRIVLQGFTMDGRFVSEEVVVK